MGRLMDNYDTCGSCGVSLQGDPIPKESQHLFGATHFSKKIGVYDLAKDRTAKFICPECGEEVEHEFFK